MVKMYIYECVMDNDKKIIKKNLNDLCEEINTEIMVNDYNNQKEINCKCIYNYFNRNKYPPYMKSLVKTEIKDYFMKDLINEYGEDYINTKTNQSVNRRLRQIYQTLNTE